MAGVKEVCFMVIALLFISTSAQGQVHHVVGGDQGWDSSSDVESWSSNRAFWVGDNLWFTYSAAQESISEVKTKEEYESCDLSNPIRMYTDGVNKVNLDGEGTRYFVSGKPDNCKNGLKLHVEVLPLPKPEEEKPKSIKVGEALAAGPTPSGSVRLQGAFAVVLFGLAMIYSVGF